MFTIFFNISLDKFFELCLSDSSTYHNFVPVGESDVPYPLRDLVVVKVDQLINLVFPSQLLLKIII